jgi:1,4-alpha-glucan branching enzyme
MQRVGRIGVERMEVGNMVTVEIDGSLTFRVYLPHAQTVELVADFTDWGTGRLALTRESPADDAFSAIVDDADGGDVEDDADADLAGELQDASTSERGWWSVRVHAPDGDHAFSYLIDNQWWLPDYAAHGVKRNEQGHWTSLLFVPPRPRLMERLGERRSFARNVRRTA